jgi:hypothetical protein
MHDEELQQHHHRDVMHHAVAERGRPEQVTRHAPANPKSGTADSPPPVIGGSPSGRSDGSRRTPR